MPTPTNKVIELREKWLESEFVEKIDDMYLTLSNESPREIADWWLNELNLAVQEAEQRGYENYRNNLILYGLRDQLESIEAQIAQNKQEIISLITNRGK